MRWFTRMPSGAHSSDNALAKKDTRPRMTPDNTNMSIGCFAAGPVMNNMALPRLK